MRNVVQQIRTKNAHFETQTVKSQRRGYGQITNMDSNSTPYITSIAPFDVDGESQNVGMEEVDHKIPNINQCTWCDRRQTKASFATPQRR